MLFRSGFLFIVIIAALFFFFLGQSWLVPVSGYSVLLYTIIAILFLYTAARVVLGAFSIFRAWLWFTRWIGWAFGLGALQTEGFHFVHLFVEVLLQDFKFLLREASEEWVLQCETVGYLELVEHHLARRPTLVCFHVEGTAVELEILVPLAEQMRHNPEQCIIL